MENYVSCLSWRSGMLSNKFNNGAGEDPLKEGLRRALCAHAPDKPDTELALVLIEKGAPLGLYENGMVSPLTHAVAIDATDVVEAILKKGVPVDQRTVNGMTPLMIAARDGKVATLKLLIAKGADVHATMNDGTSV